MPDSYLLTKPFTFPGSSGSMEWSAVVPRALSTDRFRTRGPTTPPPTLLSYSGEDQGDWGPGPGTGLWLMDPFDTLVEGLGDLVLVSLKLPDRSNHRFRLASRVDLAPWTSLKDPDLMTWNLCLRVILGLEVTLATTEWIPP